MEWPATIGLPGTVKHTSRAPWIAAAQALQVDEVLLCSSDGRILEANRSNVFVIREGTIQTPPLDGSQLAGITRAALLEAGQQAGLPIQEKAIYSWEDFDALYLSSTLKELSPVTALGEEVLPEHHPLGDALHDAFRSLIEQECL